jgi:hypothetical protein
VNAYYCDMATQMKKPLDFSPLEVKYLELLFNNYSSELGKLTVKRLLQIMDMETQLLQQINDTSFAELKLSKMKDRVRINTDESIREYAKQLI